MKHGKACLVGMESKHIMKTISIVVNKLHYKYLYTTQRCPTFWSEKSSVQCYTRYVLLTPYKGIKATKTHSGYILEDKLKLKPYKSMIKDFGAIKSNLRFIRKLRF